jgi:hypothetical protein
VHFQAQPQVGSPPPQEQTPRGQLQVKNVVWFPNNFFVLFFFQRSPKRRLKKKKSVSITMILRARSPPVPQQLPWSPQNRGTVENRRRKLSEREFVNRFVEESFQHKAKSQRGIIGKLVLTPKLKEEGTQLYARYDRRYERNKARKNAEQMRRDRQRAILAPGGRHIGRHLGRHLGRQ